MRIIGGKAKGHRLKTPKTKKIRPVLDQVKESMFNIIGPLDDCWVLDLFAGTGSVGLEAASRGAQVIFVDQLPEALKILEENRRLTHLESCTQVVRGRLPGALKTVASRRSLVASEKQKAFEVSNSEENITNNDEQQSPESFLPAISDWRPATLFDIVFIDPPYDKDLLKPCLEGLISYNLVDPHSQIVIEHSPREIPEHPAFQLVDQRKYGQTLISFLRLITEN